ncbi:hypothetical protein CAEBREN_09136 [Caenorhabditis brenneri]|uniref:Uncharacterized protein n=1 Tax=Caenorhabditis brenneri TaxID=135651 RepID=G0P929_CAEBE|nr:hypothetical protein CAEBREN_09136 [Caenorhabditis brenneri]
MQWVIFIFGSLFIIIFISSYSYHSHIIHLYSMDCFQFLNIQSSLEDNCVEVVNPASESPVDDPAPSEPAQNSSQSNGSSNDDQMIEENRHEEEEEEDLLLSSVSSRPLVKSSPVSNDTDDEELSTQKTKTFMLNHVMYIQFVFYSILGLQSTISNFLLFNKTFIYNHYTHTHLISHLMLLRLWISMDYFEIFLIYRPANNAQYWTLTGCRGKNAGKLQFRRCSSLHTTQHITTATNTESDEELQTTGMIDVCLSTILTLLRSKKLGIWMQSEDNWARPPWKRIAVNSNRAWISLSMPNNPPVLSNAKWKNILPMVELNWKRSAANYNRARISSGLLNNPSMLINAKWTKTVYFVLKSEQISLLVDIN